MVRAMRFIATAVLLAWTAVGLGLTLGPGNPLPGQVVEDNFVPFHTIGIYLANPDSAFWLTQAVGNLLLLLPVGLLGPVVVPWLGSWWRVLLVALLISVSIEAVQGALLADRAADIDDVMLNVLGALLGYALFRVAVPSRRATEAR
jgi:glycopeptide antibiotics resistance protein